MVEHIHAGADALTVDTRDDVATALRDLCSGESATVWVGEDMIEINLIQDVAFGHKLAVKDIDKGSIVRKYGEVMGRATVDIKMGSHVHVHNIESIRGRGDQVDLAAGGEHV